MHGSIELGGAWAFGLGRRTYTYQESVQSGHSADNATGPSLGWSA